MSRAHLPPPELALHPFSWAAGVASVGAAPLRGPAYRPMVRGARWVSGREITHGRLIQAFREVLPAHAVLGGWSAAWVHDLRWATVDSPVEIVLPARDRVRVRERLAVRSDALLPEEIEGTWLGPATTAARTAYDLARRLDPRPDPGLGGRPGTAGRTASRSTAPAGPGAAAVPDRWLGEAVAAVDALLRQTGTAVSEVLEVAARHPGSRGCRRALEVLALADPRAESPRESQLRVLLVRAGLPAPDVQVLVRDDGRFVARLDLAWPELRVGIEYDGAHHRDRRQHSRDLRRHNELRALGWSVHQVDADQFADPERLLDDVARLLASRT